MQHNLVNFYTYEIDDNEVVNESDKSVNESNEVVNNDPVVIRLNTHQMHRCVANHLGETQAKVFVSSLLIILINMGLAKVVGKERYNKEDGSLSSKTCTVYEITLEEGCITTKLFNNSVKNSKS